jgi:DNA-binding NarL/FixJ family response regulator
MKPIRVLIADDHTLVRRGINDILKEVENVEVVGEAVNGEDAVTKAEALGPDMVLMDVNMPVCDGVEATRRLQEKHPEIRVLMLTISAERADLLESMKAGARGYMLKSDEPELLVQAVHFVANGGTLVSPSMSDELAHDAEQSGLKAPDPPLTATEEDLLKILGNGHSDRVIAYRLATTESAVATMRSNICHKLRIANRRETLVTYAKRSYSVTAASLESSAPAHRQAGDTEDSKTQPAGMGQVIEAGQDFEFLILPPVEPLHLLKVHKLLKDKKGANIWEVTSSLAGETVITLSMTEAMQVSEMLMELSAIADASVLPNESTAPRRISLTMKDG